MTSYLNDSNFPITTVAQQFSLEHWEQLPSSQIKVLSYKPVLAGHRQLTEAAFSAWMLISSL